MKTQLRRLRWWLFLAIATTAFALPAAPAHAYVCAVTVDRPSGCPVYPSRYRHMVDASYKGWGYIQGRGDCPTGAMCFAAGEPWVRAWRWTGSSWVPAWLERDEQVYAWPYAGSWHWAWTQRTGWVAVETTRIYTWEYRPIPL